MFWRFEVGYFPAGAVMHAPTLLIKVLTIAVALITLFNV